MKKRVGYLALAAIMALCSCAVVSCGKEPAETVTVNGKFYTMQEACDEKAIYVEDCVIVKEKWENSEDVELDKEIERKITEDYYAVNALVGDDFKITYYGEYNGNHVVYIQDMYYEFFEISYRTAQFFRDPVPIEDRYGSEKFPWIFLRLLVWHEFKELVKVNKFEPAGVLLSLGQSYERGFIKKEELPRAMKSYYYTDLNIDVGNVINDNITSYYDLRLLNMDPVNLKYYDVFENGCTILYIFGMGRYCPNNFYGTYFIENIGGVEFWDYYPARCVWVPIELILREE